jgi:hypothetical protein
MMVLIAICSIVLFVVLRRRPMEFSMYVVFHYVYFVAPAILIQRGVISQPNILGNSRDGHFVVLSVVFLFLLTYVLSPRLFPQLRVIEFEVVPVLSERLTRILYLISFSILVVFYTLRIGEIRDVGYEIMHNGTIIKKNIPVILAEYIFLWLSFTKPCLKYRWKCGLFIVYSILVSMTGLRAIGVLSMLVFLIYYNRVSKKHLVYLLSSGVVFGPLLLIALQRFRTGDDISSAFDGLEVYRELATILSFSYEVLRTEIIETQSFFVNPFYEVLSYVNSAWVKFFGETHFNKLSGGNYAAVMTNYYRPYLFDQGITFGATAIGEVFHLAHLLGVLLLAFLYSNLSVFLYKMRISSSLYGGFLYYLVTIDFFRSVRSGSIGWLLRDFLVVIVIFFMLKPLFKWKKRLII